ncbi:MAG: phosphotransferase [Pseudomonadota bacterium]
MSDRDAEIQSFLTANGWGGSENSPVAADMSTRKYFRLNRGSETAILMDAETSMKSFQNMTLWLAKAGLTVPRILAGRADRGLLLLEDFGETSVKDALSHSAPLSDEVFGDCVDLLLRIRSAEPPELPNPTASDLAAWTTLADEHLPGINKAALAVFRLRLTEILDGVFKAPVTVSLRDFHSENMMWLPDRKGFKRLGLLDYQDAFLTHPAYDLMSLLTDARTWVSKERRLAVLAQYIEKSGDSVDAFELAFAGLSAQRNLRIMGIFARSGKHMTYLPNTYRYFIEALEHPAFDAVKGDTIRAIPEPA